VSEKELEPYYQSGESGVEHRNIGASGDHPFGDEPKEWEADLRPLIRQVSNDLYDSWEATVREYLANAETACLKVKRHRDNPDDTPFEEMIVSDSYEPRIVVEWDKSESKLTIKDNGIGMAAVEVDEVFRQIGRSAARDLGAMSGAFGMGALSFPKFIGPDNMMVMISHSRLNDDNAAYLVTLAGIEPIRGSLGDAEYGTSFALDMKKDDMNVRDAVRRYAEWMRVPVLYRELDTNGTEVFNEDWGDKRLYSDYETGKYCDSFVVPECFEAYMASDATGKTLLLSMDIDRNANKQLSAPYPFDVRLLDESGKVVESSNGNEGLMPVPQIEYDEMLLDARETSITKRLLSNQDVTAQTVQVEGGEALLVDESLLESDQPLPRADYVTDESEVIAFGPERVVLGPHDGRVVVDEDEWEKLPQGRAENFVPEDELEEYDLESETGDLCLPKPTTDRSELQSHDTFWKYIAKYFTNEYDNAIEEWRIEIQRATDTMDAIRSMEPRTVSDIRD
jgi:Molecular chaperone, HSP90 family